jgi:DNA sulfur modification protein DndD
VEQREQIEDRLQAAETEQKRLEAVVDALPDTDVALLRKTHRDFQRTREEALKRRHLSEEKTTQLKAERQRLDGEYQAMVRRSRAAARVRARLQAAEDVRSVLLGAYEAIERDEIPAVSRAMNRYFLDMIGGDPQHTIIQEAAVTENYDIVVYGPMRRILDPDTDLNGASRRALTLAFILALTEVSGVKAPNVIDTPLGMMSPQIKRAAVETAVEHSNQLVLLLTRSEIRDIEDLIDRYAGAAITLSSSAHYPKWLRNDPRREYFAALRCDCTHRQYCAVCERTGDAERSELLRRAS